MTNFSLTMWSDTFFNITLCCLKLNKKLYWSELMKVVVVRIFSFDVFIYVLSILTKIVVFVLNRDISLHMRSVTATRAL